MKKLFSLQALFTLGLGILIGVAPVSAEPWKFGVMSDTQWTVGVNTSGPNPYTVPVSIINQINQQLIQSGVKFVIQVGDLTDNGEDISEITRANAAQPLIDASIGYFPMRGNHELYSATDPGPNPVPNDYGIPIFRSNYPQTQTGIFTKSNLKKYKLGFNFNSPTNVSSDLTGMSYSFDFGDDGGKVRFVIIDPWATPSKVDNNADGYQYGYTINDQQGWISDRLDKKKRHTEHAFVFSHQPLIAENHQDTMFSGYTNANLPWQDAFYASMDSNDARYFISGHDHVHQRSIVKSPDRNSQVEELIAASNSSKFYVPKTLDNANWFGQKVRETSISQELYTPGYYIYTVDGPCVAVDYFSDSHGNWQSDAKYPYGSSDPNYPLGVTPTFNFIKKESWGYCQNGQEFLVPQTASYTVVKDSFEGTTAKILDGANNSTTRDGSLDKSGGVGRPLTKAVNTGWEDVDGWCNRHPDHKWRSRYDLASNIFKLLGMAELNPTGFTGQTDQYVLSLTYDGHRLFPYQLGQGLLGLVSRDKNGDWVNAVDLNTGGTKKFVIGPYKSGYGLGTYGLDPKTRTVWAVINHAGDFAAAGFRHFE